MGKTSKTVSEREAAKALNLSRGALQEARRRGDLVRSVSRDGRGRLRVDVAAAREELAEVAALRVTSGAGNPEVLRRWREARARREAALAALAEDQFRVSRGELVEVAGVATRWATMITNAKTKLLGIPSRLKQRAPHLGLADLALVDELLVEALQDLAASAKEDVRVPP